VVHDRYIFAPHAVHCLPVDICASKQTDSSSAILHTTRDTNTWEENTVALNVTTWPPGKREARSTMTSFEDGCICV